MDKFTKIAAVITVSYTTYNIFITRNYNLILVILGILILIYLTGRKKPSLQEVITDYSESIRVSIKKEYEAYLNSVYKTKYSQLNKTDIFALKQIGFGIILKERNRMRKSNKIDKVHFNYLINNYSFKNYSNDFDEFCLLINRDILMSQFINQGLNFIFLKQQTRITDFLRAAA